MESPDFSHGVDLRRYKERVEQFVREHEDYLVIQKIKRAQPLTPQDVTLLEQFFFKADGVGPRETFREAYGAQDGLPTLIRRIVGLDRAAAKTAFAEFLDGKTCTAAQIEFVSYIIDHLCRNGFFRRAELYQSPFTELHYKSVDGLFEPSQADRLLTVLEQMNQPLAGSAA